MASQAESKKTYYVVQSFSEEAAGLRMDAPIQALTEASALKTAERLSERKVSVLAFARTGDPATGEFDEPVVLASYGRPIGDSMEDLPF
ncbi:hypothetical protein [Methylobacterium durans]|uniref:hypothetical protein n=1 Tax=Methylobacterium durans TaxID=2202825 RepID=UPI0013A52E99|nr:hypothetical protein [Methylobacterium durans]